MSKQEHSEENNDQKVITYVYIPDEDINGFIIKEGVYMSTVQYFENGVGYIIDIPNDEFIIVDEIGIGHIEETEENL